jgi:hypothetical protein
MRRLSIVILIFSIAFTLFFLVPPLLDYKFGPYPLMHVADVFDLFTPLVLIPLYWLLFQLDKDKPPTPKITIIFSIFVAFWVLGQGMHLASNSIGHLLEEMRDTDAYILTCFYDEVLSHYLWHFGVMALSCVLIYRQWHNPFTEGQGITWAIILAGIFYGFTYFALVIEGATTPMGVPFSILITMLIFVYKRNKLTQQPVIFFFLIAYLFAILLFLIWGIWWGSLPEFSQAGIIK